jgi:hypothetical protein
MAKLGLNICFEPFSKLPIFLFVLIKESRVFISVKNYNPWKLILLR